MTKRTLSTLCAAQAALVAGCALLASPTFAAQPKTVADIFAPYLKMHSYSGVIKTTTTIAPLKGGSGATNIYGTIKFEYQTPNKMHVEIMGMMGSTQMVCDGKTSYTYSAITNTWSSSPAPKSPISMMTQSMGDIEGLHLSGQKTVAGQPCDVYIGKSVSPVGNGTVAIAVGVKDQLIHKMLITLPAVGTPQGGKFRLTVDEEYQSQQPNASIPASEFRFQPPAGAQKASQANMPAIMGGMGGSMP